MSMGDRQGRGLRGVTSGPTVRALVVVGLLLGLATSPALARGEWYDHYEEALQALQAGDHQRAIELLETALKRKKRSGYFRTYGNNYVRYLPHFYLGVAHHDAGNCRQSLADFERSEAAQETEPLPALAARLQSLRGACQALLAPPPVAPEPARIAELEPAVPAESEGPPETPPDPVVKIDPKQLEHGLRAYLKGDVTGATRTFGDLARTSPRSATLHLLLGMALHASWVIGGETDRDLLERAREELSEAARLDPGLVPDPALCPPSVVALYRSLR